MRLRSWRGSTPLSASTRRPFPWARLLLVLIVLGIAAYFLVPGYFYIRADALVQGDLVPVAPLYRARVDKLLAHCDDHVTAGQKVAIVSNFLVQGDYQHQALQSAQELQLSTIALDQNVAAARTNALTMHEKYTAALLDAQRLGETFRSYDSAYRQGAIARVDWLDKRTEWQSAEAVARSANEAWKRAEQEVGRISADQSARISSGRQLSEQSQSLANRVSSEPLLAPVSGYIVKCVDRPQNVVEPSTPLYSIFEPNRAYVLAYFDPNSVAKVHVGQLVDLSIAGLSHNPVTGRISAIYPDLSKLPPQLTRFFWQHEQWSQYRPVKILLDRLPPADRQQLYYGAQARVSIRIRDNWRSAEIKT